MIDLGVMVPCDKILKEAIIHNAGALYVLDRLGSLPNPECVKSSSLTTVFIFVCVCACTHLILNYFAVLTLGQITVF